MDPVKVGKAIRTLRTQAGYTQSNIAELLGVTNQAVSKWERGLSVPDISIVTNLSVLLNVDVDNLLEGNITYLENTWQGLLILENNERIHAGSEVYGKPLVYLLLCYFMLAGIGSIYISCPENDRRFIGELIGDGSRFGLEIHYLVKDKRPPEAKNTMVVYNNPFVYGPNLTKYFHRAMSRKNGISVLTVDKTTGGKEIMIAYDNYKAVKKPMECDIKQFCAPIVFFPKEFYDQIENAENVSMLDSLYAEPMGNGMIEYSILDEDAICDTALFFRFIKRRIGKDVYNIEEVAKNRFFYKK